MKSPKVIIGAVVAIAVLIGLALIPGGAKPDPPFEVASEFDLHPLIELPKLGPIDLSITKAVVYLWIAVAVIVVFALIVSRALKLAPSRFQYAMETMYDLARKGIVGSVMKSGQDTWFPYIGAAFFFVLVSNIVGLIPLPFGEHHQFAFYAATGNINITIVLALCTFVFTHYSGVRKNGPIKYVRAWAPGQAPPVLKQIIWAIHVVSEVFRLVSLSVRLFANMVAGHAILAVFFGMALIFQSYLIGTVLQGASLLIYMFELFVAFIQAFIFAILSSVYIGGALDQDH
ncbi:MAG: F0F1 ATP synthase subunit A [Alphaproteobacteria bacterium]|nr:F0F1 ATP synthase subunit A [Alphaproteobacteria bacterium]